MSEEQEPQVICHLDRIMEERGITGAALAKEVGITPVNLSVLKNNRAKAVRFNTLAALCTALDCQPGDIFEVEQKTLSECWVYAEL